MKSHDFKIHATYFNILSPVSELSDYRDCSLLIQGFPVLVNSCKWAGRTETLSTPQVNIQ